MMNRPRRENETGPGIVLITGFLTFADAVDACTLLLNSPEAAPGLRQLYGAKDGHRQEFKAIDVGRCSGCAMRWVAMQRRFCQQAA